MRVHQLVWIVSPVQDTNLPIKVMRNEYCSSHQSLNVRSSPAFESARQVPCNDARCAILFPRILPETQLKVLLVVKMIEDAKKLQSWTVIFVSLRISEGTSSALVAVSIAHARLSRRPRRRVRRQRYCSFARARSWRAWMHSLTASLDVSAYARQRSE